MPKQPLRHSLILLFLYLVWGTSYAATTIGLKSIPPLAMSGIRFTFCGLVLAPFIKKLVQAPDSCSGKEVLRMMVGGVLLVTSNALLVWSQQMMPSGLASLFIGSVPLQMILLNWISFDRSTPSLKSFIGIIIGLLGLVFIGVTTASNPHLFQSSLVLIVCAFLWSLGSLVMRSIPSQFGTWGPLGVQFLCGGIFVSSLSFLLNENWQFSLWIRHFPSLYALFYLILFSSFLGFYLYQLAMQEMRPEVASTYALVNPLIALGVGALYLGEKISMNEMLASALVLLGLYMILNPFRSALVKKNLPQSSE